MGLEVAIKDAEISQLKAKVYQLMFGGHGTFRGLRSKNVELKTQVTTLTDEVLGF